MDTTPLTMATISDLPGHGRSCVFWEVDPEAGHRPLLDAAFEKEAWLSMVMLDWGTCGRIAWEESEAVGYALYAPPSLMPYASRFPTGPVSTDAILLSQLTGIADQTGSAAGRSTILLDAVIGDLIRRGVRAVESFGYREASAEAPGDPDFDPADLVRGVPESAGPDCTCGRCMIPAEFLAAWGFEEVAPHHRFPRYRLELGRDLGWKAEVEAAIESLFDVEPVVSGKSGDGAPLVTARAVSAHNAR
ncbi:GNAT family N-acetyltransferase [Tomitella fengzijianii]|uniref:GNAT family N-acetyltransferase n=1 Tax=Tomitella fengzijianii TaxID=2597660 RepID=UPI00355666E7